jgi:hypothetical protein
LTREDWMVVLTGVLAATSTLGNCMAVKAVGDAREATRVDQRAWLGVSETVAVPLTVGEQLRVSVKFVNSGKTPALHLSEAAAWLLLPASQQPDLPNALLGHVSATNGVVAPGSPRTDSVAVGSVTQDDINALNSGAYVFYIVGQMNYEDVFGEKHQTNYCLRRDPASTGLVDCNTFNSMN